MSKIDRIEEYSRIKLIQEQLAKGYSMNAIKKFIRDKFGVSSDASQGKWIKKALEELYSDSPHKDFIRNINAERLERVYDEAMEKKDYGAAVKAIDVLNRQVGIYPQSSVRIENNKNDKKEELVVTVNFGS